MYLRVRGNWQVTRLAQDFSYSPVHVCNSASEARSPVSLGFAYSVNTGIANWQEVKLLGT